jgi:hypothetical protein
VEREPNTEDCIQVPELLKCISAPKKKGMTADRVAFSFMKRRVQPLMKWEHLGYEYTDVGSDSRLTADEINNDEVIEKPLKIFRNMKPKVSSGCPANNQYDPLAV